MKRLTNLMWQASVGASVVRRHGLSVVVLCVIAMMAQPAKATVTLLTGGDAGEGFSPAATPIYAWYVPFADDGHLGDKIVQGVTFKDGTAQPNVTINQTGHFSGSSNTFIPGVSTNDANLGWAVRDFFYHGADAPFDDGTHTITATLHNLNPGQTYQVDLFIAQSANANLNGGRSQEIRINGLLTDTKFFEDSTHASPIGPYPTGVAPVYDVRNSAIADVNGKITVAVTATTTDFNGFINALAVTQAAVPEPSSIAMLICGGVAMLGCMRRRRGH